MDETPLITNVPKAGNRIDVTADPVVSYRMEAQTETGSLVLVLSRQGAVDLHACLARLLGK